MSQDFPYRKYTPGVFSMSIRQADINTSAALGDDNDHIHKLGMKNLKAIRKSQKLSQADLADMVGVKQATISRIEKGVNNPSLDVANRIPDAMNINVVELFGIPELEQKVLQSFREASPERRAALLTLLGTD